MQHTSLFMLRITAVTLASGLVIASCGGFEAVDTETTVPIEVQQPGTTLVPTKPTPVKERETVIGTVEESYPIDPDLQPFIDLAVEDLADNTGANPEDITVRNAYVVTWPDSSLGCPEPGKVYLPAVNGGSVIELEVGNALYRYHTGGSLAEPFPCESPSRDESVVNTTPLEGTPLELDEPVEKYPDETVPPPGYDD